MHRLQACTLRILLSGMLLLSSSLSLHAQRTVTLQEWVSHLETLVARTQENTSEAVLDLYNGVEQWGDPIQVLLPPKAQGKTDTLSASLSWIQTLTMGHSTLTSTAYGQERMADSTEEDEEKYEGYDFHDYENSLSSQDAQQRALMLRTVRNALTAMILDARHLGDVNIELDTSNINDVIRDPQYKPPVPEEDKRASRIRMPRTPRPEFIEFIRENIGYIFLLILASLGLWWLIRSGLLLQPGWVNAQEKTDFTGLLQQDDPDTSQEMLQRAADAETRGEWPAAVRYQYLAIILLLDEQRIIPYKSSFTDWEYCRMMVSIGFELQVTEEVTRLFDRSHYGRFAVSGAEFNQYREQVQRVRGQMAQFAGGSRA